MVDTDERTTIGSGGRTKIGRLLSLVDDAGEEGIVDGETSRGRVVVACASAADGIPRRMCLQE